MASRPPPESAADPVAGTRRTGRRLMALALAAACIALSACDIDTDFADDLVEKTAERNRLRLQQQQRQELPLPDPEVVPYLAVTSEQLAPDPEFRVDLTDELVIGGGREEPEYLFVSFIGRSSALGNVAVDDRGRLFVLETRSDRVRVFDADGEFRFAFGQPGQGPTDFQDPFGIEIAGDRVHVYHRRFDVSIWDTDGNFIRDRQILRTPEALAAEQLLDAAAGTSSGSREEARQRAAARDVRVPFEVFGRPDRSMLMVFREEPLEQSGRITTPFVRVLGRFEDGVEVERLFTVPEWATPDFAPAPDGGLYVGMFGHMRTELYVVALDAAMQPRWVLMAPWDPDAPPRAYLRVDPEGRLYVFPNFIPVEGDPRSPVQVYGPDGSLIGSGYANRRPIYLHWQQIAGGRIHGVRPNPETEEWEVVRYRVDVTAREALAASPAGDAAVSGRGSPMRSGLSRAAPGSRRR